MKIQLHDLENSVININKYINSTYIDKDKVTLIIWSMNNEGYYKKYYYNTRSLLFKDLNIIQNYQISILKDVISNNNILLIFKSENRPFNPKIRIILKNNNLMITDNSSANYILTKIKYFDLIKFEFKNSVHKKCTLYFCSNIKKYKINMKIFEHTETFHIELYYKNFINNIFNFILLKDSNDYLSKLKNIIGE